MALLIDGEFKGIPVKNAYAKICSIGGSKVHDWAVIFQVRPSVDSTDVLDHFIIKFPYSGSDANFYAAAYNFMKTDNFIQDSIDLCEDKLSDYVEVLKTITNVRDA